jgi:hypothetical protein
MKHSNEELSTMEFNDPFEIEENFVISAAEKLSGYFLFEK